MISIPSLASLSATVAALDSHLVLTRATFRECFVDGSGNIGFLPASPGRVLVDLIHLRHVRVIIEDGEWFSYSHDTEIQM